MCLQERYGCIKGTAPQYLHELITRYLSVRRHMWFSIQSCLRIPSVDQRKTTTNKQETCESEHFPMLQANCETVCPFPGDSFIERSFNKKQKTEYLHLFSENYILLKLCASDISILLLLLVLLILLLLLF